MFLAHPTPIIPTAAAAMQGWSHTKVHRPFAILPKNPLHHHMAVTFRCCLANARWCYQDRTMVELGSLRSHQLAVIQQLAEGKKGRGGETCGQLGTCSKASSTSSALRHCWSYCHCQAMASQASWCHQPHLQHLVHHLCLAQQWGSAEHGCPE